MARPSGRVRWVASGAVLVILAPGLWAQSKPAMPKFMGREVTTTEAAPSDDGFYPKGPASVCTEGPPQRQCYTAPKDFGRVPHVEVIQLDKNTPALFFSAASGGVSGWAVHLALLRPGMGQNLENIFPGDLAVSNQCQNVFWNEPAISNAPIFVTADFVWGPEEAHYSDHRYRISAYVYRYDRELEASEYGLDDEYMTIRKYSPEDSHILDAEKPEILVRLQRVKAERDRAGKTQ